MHDFWTGLLLAAAGKPTIGFFADRIGQRFVGTGEVVPADEMTLQGCRKSAGHGELVIGERAARGGNVRHGAVEDDSPRFILIEALVDQVFQETPALRRAKTDGPTGRHTG